MRFQLWSFKQNSGDAKLLYLKLQNKYLFLFILAKRNLHEFSVLLADVRIKSVQCNEQYKFCLSISFFSFFSFCVISP